MATALVSGFGDRRSDVVSPAGLQQLEEPSELAETVGAESGGPLAGRQECPQRRRSSWQGGSHDCRPPEFQHQMDHPLQTGPAQRPQLGASQRMVGIGNGDLSGERCGKLRNVCSVG